MNTSKKGWYVMYTKARHEQKASKQLEEKSILHYLPKVKVPNKNKKVFTLRETPVFPSYLFVYLDRVDTFYESTRIEGFLKYVRFGEELAVLSETVIDRLKTVIERGKQVQVRAEDIIPGKRLLISRGPLCGMDCEVIKRKSSRNIHVNIRLLGRTISAVVADQHLSVIL